VTTWAKVTLAELCPAKTGTVDPTKNPDSLFLYIDITSVDVSRKEVTEARWLTGRDAPSRARRRVLDGDVIVSMTRPNLNAVALIGPEQSGQVCSTGFCVLRPGPRLDAGYLFHFVRTKNFVQALTALVSGALYPAVSEGQVRQQTIPLPPLEEQRRIADILDRAASIRRLRRQAQDTARQIIPAMFNKMFGDPGTNPMGWPAKPFGNLLSGCDYGTSEKASDTPDGIPVIRMGNVTLDGRLNLGSLKYLPRTEADIARYGLERGDLLFNRTNSKELVGKMGMWDGSVEALAASYFIRCRVDRVKMVPEFAWVFFNTSFMKQRLFETARGAIGQANINSKELKAFVLPAPPRHLQEAFAERIGALMRVQEQHARSAAAEQGITASIQARLFG
jgi:type I restriction enzyme, S subunit